MLINALTKTDKHSSQDNARFSNSKLLENGCLSHMMATLHRRGNAENFWICTPFAQKSLCERCENCTNGVQITPAM